MVDKRRVRAREYQGQGNGVSSTGGRGGGIGPVFFIMAGVVLVVIILAFIAGGGGGEKRTTGAEARGTGQYAPRPKKVYPPQEPWTGQINDMTGTVRQGMHESQVIAQFNPPDVENVTFSEFNGIRTLEFADYAGQGGILRTGGGVKLLVKVDMATQRVVWFRPPKRIGEEDGQ
jgi:hypothetical protein